jgi:hypothetical protein
MIGKFKRMAFNLGQIRKNHLELIRKIEKRRQDRRQHGAATLETGATSQMLLLYSDVQKRARFALCDECLHAALRV